LKDNIKTNLRKVVWNMDGTSSGSSRIAVFIISRVGILSSGRIILDFSMFL